jgi:hypothetical protein
MLTVPLSFRLTRLLIGWLGTPEALVLFLKQ